MLKRYSIFHVPVYSFFSKTLYQDVCHQWKGTGFAYLLLLLGVCWIPTIVSMDHEISSFIDIETPKIVSQIPELSIVDGKASIEEAQPYFITDPDTGQELFIIDTMGTITSLSDTSAIGLITRTEATIKKSQIETRTFSFATIPEYTLDQYVVTDWLNAIKKYLAIFIYPFALMGSFVLRIIQVLIYAVIGLLFAALMKSERKYGELLRLSVVAITPGILIKTFFLASQINLPFSGTLFFLLAMGLLFFGVKAASEYSDEVDEVLFNIE